MRMAIIGLVDPFHRAWPARALDVPTELIEPAGKVNRQMPVRDATATNVVRL